MLAGERSTGKTALASMLAGASFSEVYEPTAAPRASYVEWLYKSTNEQGGRERGGGPPLGSCGLL